MAKAPELTAIESDIHDGWIELGEVRSPFAPPPFAPPHPVDADARATLDAPALERYFRYKASLFVRAEPPALDDLDPILRGFIWAELGD